MPKDLLAVSEPKDLLAKKGEKEPGFFSRVGDALSKRWHTGEEEAAKFGRGEISLPEYLLATTGKVTAAAGNDIVGEGISSAYKAGVGPKTREGISTAKDAFVKGAHDVGEAAGKTETGLAVGEKLRSGVESASDIMKKHPRTMSAAESVADIGSLLLGAKGAGSGIKAIEAAAPKAKAFGQTLVDEAKSAPIINKGAFKGAITPPPAPPPPGLLKGAGGKPLTISEKNMEGGRSILRTALKEDDINPLDVAQKLEEAKASGLPVTAADVMTREVGGVQTHGKNVLGLLKGAANMPGPGAAMAGEVGARGYSTSKRIGSALDKHMSSQGVYDISDGALEKMRTETPKAYKKAFEGGSIAPLEKQLEGEFRDTLTQRSAAKQKLDQLNQQLTFIESKKQTNANIYKDNSLIHEKRRVHEEMAQAQKEYDAALEREESSRGILRQAQEDKKNGVKGAVWSPRINEMLQDDSIQAGIKRGLRIAKKEALANGEKFNPHEFGITGYDEVGDPIISKVPNMRMLDAGKKGLDAIINESKNPLTGKMNEMGRAVSMLKSSYLKEIDALNPDYALARRQYADQASVLESLNNGRDFLSMDKEEISRFMKDPDTSPPEKAAFAAGVRRTLQERIESQNDGVNSIWKQGIKDKIREVFPDEQSFKQFETLMDQEKNMKVVNSALATGSHTNQLANYQGAMKTPGKVLKAVTNPQGAALDYGMEQMSKVLMKQAKNMSKDQAAIISRYLTTDDPEVWYDLARRPQ